MTLPLVVALSLWLFWPTLKWLNVQWNSDEYYAHGPFLPFISAYLIWAKRDVLSAAWQKRPRANWRPSTLIFIALILQIFGMLADMNMVRALQAIALPVLILGAAKYLGGRSFERELRFPLLFFWLAVPLSGPMVELLTVPMQNYAANGSALCLGLLGFPIERVGVNLYTPKYHFVVAVPCSGLKTTITLLTLSVLVAHLMPGLRQGQRLLLIAVSIPIALAANTLRVIAIVAVGHLMGKEAAEGFLHNGSGLMMFALAIAALIGLGSWLGQANQNSLQRRPREGTAPISAPETKTDLPVVAETAPWWNTPIFKKQIALVTMILAARYIGQTALAADVDAPKSAPRLELASRIGEWQGRSVKIDPIVYEVLQPDAVTQKNYILNAKIGAKPSSAPANVQTLVIYSRDPRGLHSPITCLRAQGWLITNERVQLVSDGKQSLYLNVVTGEMRGRQTQLAYLFADADQATTGRIATFAKMVAARFLRRRVGAVEVQFGFDGRCVDRDGNWTPEFKALIFETTHTVRRALRNS